MLSSQFRNLFKIIYCNDSFSICNGYLRWSANEVVSSKQVIGRIALQMGIHSELTFMMMIFAIWQSESKFHEVIERANNSLRQVATTGKLGGILSIWNDILLD